MLTIAPLSRLLLPAKQLQKLIACSQFYTAIFSFVLWFRWGLYVLWLKYLGNFWPEDVGFVRTAIEDMELSDHRRIAGRKTSGSPTQQQQQRPHHTYIRGRGGLQAAAGSASHYASSTQETVKILRAHVRELEMADEAGEVGEIRRRRRPKVAAAASNYSPLATSSASLSPDLSRLSSSVQASTTSTSQPGQRRDSVSTSEVPGSSASPMTASASSSTMDNHVSHAHHQYLRQNSISGEQQNGSSSSINSGVPSEEDENGVRSPMRVASMFGGEERRRPEPEYYVGEVFRHLIYRYTGVIYGYDLSKLY